MIVFNSLYWPYKKFPAHWGLGGGGGGEGGGISPLPLAIPLHVHAQLGFLIFEPIEVSVCVALKPK